MGEMGGKGRRTKIELHEGLLIYTPAKTTFTWGGGERERERWEGKEGEQKSSYMLPVAWKIFYCRELRGLKPGTITTIPKRKEILPSPSQPGG
jgi:hypothetical protein